MQTRKNKINRENNPIRWIVSFGILGILCFLILSCYEGSNRPNKGGNGGNGGGDAAPKASTAPYYFILFEPVFLTPESMMTSSCYNGNESEIIYRNNEWSRRISLIRAGLEKMADQFIENDIRIQPTDCKTLNAIEARATTKLNNATGKIPTTPDSKKRLSLHLKAIFWDHSATSLYPSSNVRSLDWKDVKDLKNLHIPAASLFYFVHSNQSQWGYFDSWKWGIPSELLLSISGIATPDAGENGLNLREQQIQNETKQFFEWFLGAANAQASKQN